MRGAAEPRWLAAAALAVLAAVFTCEQRGERGEGGREQGGPDTQLVTCAVHGSVGSVALHKHHQNAKHLAAVHHGTLPASP